VTAAWHRLRRAPGFALLATLTIALGIGANTAVFSVLDPLLLRSLPVTAPDELVLLHSAGTLFTDDISERAAFDRYSTEHTVLGGVLADAGLAEYQTSYNGVPATARGEVVSANYFSVLGVRPSQGRLLAVDDDAARGSVVVLSHDYWTRAFGADTSVVGRTLIVGGKAETIVGVAPPEFRGLTVESSPDFYAPLGSGLSRAAWITVVARLKPGVSLRQAQAALEPVFEQIAHLSDLPDIERRQSMARLLVTPAGRGLSDLRGRFALPAWVLMAVVVLVLVVACANVANLILARSASRRREIATELALGATRGRLVRQFVIESALLASAGAAAGVLAAHWISAALVSSLSVGRAPVTLATGINMRVLAFTVVMLGLTIVCCGVLPAIVSTRANLIEDLKSTRASFSRGGRRSFVGGILVVAQLGVTVTLLSAAGLLLHSVVNLNTVDVGFDRSRLLSVSLTDTVTGRPPGQAADVLARILEQTRGLPGVQAASLTGIAPLSGDETGINVVVDGRSPGASPHAFFTSVSPGYFATIGIPLLMGRDFSPDDDPAVRPVVVINQTTARHYFGDERPLGKRLRFVEGNRPPMEIVGVVADAVYNNVREPTEDFLYLCRPRQPSSARAVLLVRTNARGSGALAEPIRQLVHALAAGVTVTAARTLDQFVDDSLQGDRVVAELCSAFSLLALVVAAVGLYGSLSVNVARQTRDIGIRIALGADTRQILGFVAGHGARLTVAGLLVGAVGAWASHSVVASMLFGVHGTDPLTLVGVVLVLSAVAALACCLPARRAMRVDPVIALRSD
jgi:predicted permease